MTPVARDASDAARDIPLPWGLAWRLSLGRIVAWGILYYAFTVVVGPMQAATGWSRTFLNAGLSLGLLAWGVFALPVGAWIQRRGGRGLMAVASALGGVALIMMGAVPDRVAYVVAWLMLGTAMAGVLYDPAFTAVLAKAAAPLALAALWSGTGEPRMVFAGVLTLVLLGVGGLWLAIGAQRRHATVLSKPERGATVSDEAVHNPPK